MSLTRLYASFSRTTWPAKKCVCLQWLWCVIFHVYTLHMWVQITYPALLLRLLVIDECCSKPDNDNRLPFIEYHLVCTPRPYSRLYCQLSWRPTDSIPARPFLWIQPSISRDFFISSLERRLRRQHHFIYLYFFKNQTYALYLIGCIIYHLFVLLLFKMKSNQKSVK